jgi:hypothetical protein
MKALILCNDFPPFNSIGAQRPYSWFKYFPRNGIEATVITKNWSDKSATPAEAILALASAEKEEEITEYGKIIKVPHKLILPERIMLKYGIERFSFFRKTLSFIYKLFSFLFFAMDKNSNIYYQAEEYLKNNECDIVITTGEPFILFKYGHLLRKKYDIKWIADYRDGWYLNYVTSLNKSLVIRLIRSYEYLLEKKYIANVDSISSVDPLLTKAVSDLHSKEGICIYNGFWNYYVPERELEKPNAKLVLTYLGTLTPGQRVEELLSVISRLNRDGKISEGDLLIQFVGIEFFTEQTKRILNYDESIRKFIRTTPRVEREKALDITFNSDFLLSITDKDFQAIYAKNYDYLSVGKPILLIPDDNSILRNFILDLGLGKTFKTQKELYDFLLNQLNRNAASENLVINKEKASFYTRENQANIFANEIKKLVKAK